MTKTTVPFLLSLFSLSLFSAFVFAEPLQLQKDSEQLYRQALQLRQENRYDAALEKLRQVVAQFPNHVGALETLTELTFTLGNLEDCLHFGGLALGLDPKNADMHFYVGCALAYSGREGEAILVLTQGLKLAPGRTDFLMQLGAIEQGRKRFAEAERYFKKVLREDPTNAGAAYAIGMGKKEQGEKRAARRWFEKAIAWNAQFADPHFAQGLMALDAGDDAEAESHFAKVLEIQHVHPGAFLYLAGIEERKGNKLKSYYWLVRAVAYMPAADRRRVEEKMSQLETGFGLPREKMENFARHDVPVALGEPAGKVLRLLGEPTYRHQNDNLFIYPQSGITVRFDDGKAGFIRLDEGFRGKIHGVTLGAPVEEWTKIYGNQNRFQNELVTFSLEKGKIKAIILEWAKPKTADKG